AGADYAAFGACFASGTKPNAPMAPLKLFVQAKEKTKIPLVAIGGITLQNAPLAVQAGADAVAIVGALFNVNNNAPQIVRTAQEFSAVFDMS
ncbi:MAG: thiamine phosphate synthase, partial [Methylotenera sp.]